MFALGKWRSCASTLVVLLAVLTGCKRTLQVRGMTLREIKIADLNPETRGQRVSTMATVTYSDPEWNLLFLQDAGDGVYLAPPANDNLAAGDAVRINGNTGQSSAIIEGAQFSVLHKNGALPAAIAVGSAAQFSNYPSQFVSTSATVHWAGIRNGRATLDAVSGGVPFQAVVFPSTGEDLPRSGSEIRISGVAAAVYGSEGKIEKLQLLTPSARSIQVLKQGPADPFALPVTPVQEVAHAAVGALVHVAGPTAETPNTLLIKNGNQAIPIQLREDIPARITAADAVGFWTGQTVADAVLRPRGQQMPEHSDVERLVQLKRMTAEEAAKHHTVHVRAVVTYFDPYWHLLFLQDDSAAAFVNTRGLDVVLRPGDRVDVTGISDPGDFAPVIGKPIISVVGHGALPAPVQLDVVHGDLNEADSIRCTFRGIVHTARVRGNHTILKLEAGQSALEIDFPMVLDGAQLVDKEISVTGAFGILFNDRRQAVGHQIFVPGPEFLKVMDSQEKPHAAVTIASLRRYSPNSDEHHSVTVTGTVVAVGGGKNVFFVQDETAGVQVRTVGTADVADGDRVSARGFILPGEYSPVLEDAVVERLSAGPLPRPQTISAKRAFEGVFDSEFVQIVGKLDDLRSSPKGIVLTLNDGGTFFEAAGPSSDDLSSLRLGSQVAVRGICQVTLDRTAIPYTVHGFAVRFDSPDSVLVLKRGPWWDARKIEWALLLIFMLGAAALLWAAMLRQKVLSKTFELQSSLAAKRHAAKFDAARNQVLEGIVGNAPLSESMERLAFAIEEQMRECVFAVVMPPDGKSFQRGTPAPMLVAPSLPEDVHREMAPILSAVFAVAHEGPDAGGIESDREIMDRLLAILRRSGNAFLDGRMMVAFSGHGDAAGVLLLFRRAKVSLESEASEQNILQSASRLVALASDHWRMHTRLLHEARHDSLTGLPNRSVAEDRLEQALARANRARKSFALFCIDLDGFKSINDERGHDAGDEILRAVSQRLRNSLRHADTLARMGGDEFLVLIEDCANEPAARAVAQSLVAALQQPFVLGGKQLSLSGSVGIAMYPADGKNAAQLRRHADVAMYRAKALGGGQVASLAETVSGGQMARKSFTS